MSDEIVNPVTGEIIEKAGSEFWTAFSKAQALIEAPSKTKTANVRTKDGGSYSFDYAPLDAIIECAKKPLAENGMAFRQAVVNERGQAFVRTRIYHCSGQYDENDYPVIVSGPTAQNYASGVTYARRYGLMLALGICAEEDDDANAADQNTATIRDRGQQTQQRPPQQQRSYPAQQPTRPASGEADAARAVVVRVRDAIGKAETIEALNKAYTADDEKVVRAQNGGAKVWQQLLDRESDKRIEITRLDTYEDGSAEDGFMSAEESGNVFQR